MNISATIPLAGGQTKQFEGAHYAVEEVLNFFHADYSGIARDVMRETGMRNGSIPVIVNDADNNFAALVLDVQDEEWVMIHLEGWTDREGRWTSESVLREQGTMCRESER